jgi:pantoate--beta-alanine ligase
MIRARTIPELRAALDARRARGPLGFVPTMGALHAGHVSLFTAARRQCATVAASIFVNPTQFNDRSDLAAYPRPEEEDAAMSGDAGVDVLFLPAASVMYPDDHATTVHVEGAAVGFEGAHRPGHFDGVALVCLKLFNIVQPDRVYLGQKDAQQIAVLRRLVHDLNLRLEIVAAPTVRDWDGLALSSRNARLSAEERQRALAIPRALRAGLAAYRDGGDAAMTTRRALGDLEAEYVAVAEFDGRPTLVVAVRVGRTRLIDNVPLEQPELAGF